MTVTAPPTCGKLKALSRDLGYCDINPMPLVEDAQVVIQGGLNTYTVTTDAGGYYQWWLDAGNSPLDITMTYPTTRPARRRHGLAGITTTQDFDLRWLEPCVSVAPTQFDVAVTAGYDLKTNMAINNTGAEGFAFEILELPGSAAAQIITQAPASSPPDARTAPQQVGQTAPVRAASPTDVLVNEGFEAGVMPPPGWTVVVNNTTETWEIATTQHPILVFTRRISSTIRPWYNKTNGL